MKLNLRHVAAILLGAPTSMVLAAGSTSSDCIACGVAGDALPIRHLSQTVQEALFLDYLSEKGTSSLPVVGTHAGDTSSPSVASAAITATANRQLGTIRTTVSDKSSIDLDPLDLVAPRSEANVSLRNVYSTVDDGSALAAFLVGTALNVVKDSNAGSTVKTELVRLQTQLDNVQREAARAKKAVETVLTYGDAIRRYGPHRANVSFQDTEKLAFMFLAPADKANYIKLKGVVKLADSLRNSLPQDFGSATEAATSIGNSLNIAENIAKQLGANDTVLKGIATAKVLSVAIAAFSGPGGWVAGAMSLSSSLGIMGPTGSGASSGNSVDLGPVMDQLGKILDLQRQTIKLLNDLQDTVQKNHQEVMGELVEIKTIASDLKEKTDQATIAPFNSCKTFFIPQTQDYTENGIFKSYQKRREHYNAFSGSFKVCRDFFENNFIPNGKIAGVQFATPIGSLLQEKSWIQPTPSGGKPVSATAAAAGSFNTFGFRPAVALTKALVKQNSNCMDRLVSLLLSAPRAMSSELSQKSESCASDKSKPNAFLGPLGLPIDSDTAFSSYIFVPFLEEMLKYQYAMASYLPLLDPKKPAELLEQKALARAKDNGFGSQLMLSQLNWVQMSLAQQVLLSGPLIAKPLRKIIEAGNFGDEMATKGARDDFDALEQNYPPAPSDGRYDTVQYQTMESAFNTRNGMGASPERANDVEVMWDKKRRWVPTPKRHRCAKVEDANRTTSMEGNPNEAYRGWC